MVLPALGFLANIGLASQGLGSIAKGAADAAKAMVNFPNILTAWSDGLTQSARKLSEFNGSLAASMAKLDMEKFKMNMGESAMLAPSMLELNKQVATMQKELQPARIAAEELKTIVSIKLVQLVTAAVAFLKYIPSLGPALERIEQQLSEKNVTGSPAETFLNNISAGIFDNFRNGPVK